MITVKINGKIFTAQDGNSICVKNNRVIIDGKERFDGNSIPEKEINIEISGKTEKIEVDCCNTISVTGDVGSLQATSGDSTINGNVTGSIQTTNGDIDVDGDVGGNIQTTNGDIKVNGSVSGEVSSVCGNVITR